MSILTPVQIRFSDVDLGRHVHNAVYLHYFELGRMDLLRKVVGPDHDWVKIGLILARNEIDYRVPVHLADQITVETRCLKVGTKSFNLGYTIFSRGEGERLIHAQGMSVMVCFNYATQQTIAIPATWRPALQQLMNDGQ